MMEGRKTAVECSPGGKPFFFLFKRPINYPHPPLAASKSEKITQSRSDSFIFGRARCTHLRVLARGSFPTPHAGERKIHTLHCSHPSRSFLPRVIFPSARITQASCPDATDESFFFVLFFFGSDKTRHLVTRTGSSFLGVITRGRSAGISAPGQIAGALPKINDRPAAERGAMPGCVYGRY